MKGFDISWIVGLFNVLQKADGITARYCNGQHFWELGHRDFQKKDVIRRMSRPSEVLSAYRNTDWNSSFNFVLRSRGAK